MANNTVKKPNTVKRAPKQPPMKSPILFIAIILIFLGGGIFGILYRTLGPWAAVMEEPRQSLIFEPRITLNNQIGIDIGGFQPSVIRKPTEQTVNQTVFKCTLTIDYTVNLYTTYTSEMVYKTKTKVDRSAEWLYLATSANPATPKWFPWTYTHYYTHYKTWELGDIFATGFMSQTMGKGVLENILLTPTATINLHGLVIEQDSYLASLTRSEIIAKKALSIGEYEVFFDGRTSQNEMTSGDKALATDTIGADVGDGDASLTNAIADYGLGVTKLPQFTEQDEHGQQQAVGSQQGVIYDNQFDLSLRPNVYAIHEPLQVVYMLVVVDNTQDLSPAGVVLQYCSGKSTTQTDRIVGWKVENVGIRLQCRAVFDIISTCNVVYKEYTNKELPLPMFELEDYYFNNMLTGITNVEVDYDPTPFLEGLLEDITNPVMGFITDFLKQYWWILALVGAGVLLYFFISLGGPMMLQQAAMQRSMRKTVGGHPRDR